MNTYRNIAPMYNKELPDIEIHYKHKKVKNLNQCIIFMQNDSKTSITDKDFIKRITLDISKDIKLHNTSNDVSEIFHSSNSFSNSVFIFYRETNTLVFDIDLVEPEDMIAIRLLYETNDEKNSKPLEIARIHFKIKGSKEENDAILTNPYWGDAYRKYYERLLYILFIIPITTYVAFPFITYICKYQFPTTKFISKILSKISILDIDLEFLITLLIIIPFLLTGIFFYYKAKKYIYPFISIATEKFKNNPISWL
ncbi:hypothetical protein Hsw_0610 [Hymenobacter swuensis DY53]|uniref:Uncharacterized protein n=2 Tax=Hymenobacter TaxID=89966 RepID=W8F327_9BACT|nr:hypothetical protein Hsw_0610 [Hymenobacter swuensis DY53]